MITVQCETSNSFPHAQERMKTGMRTIASEDPMMEDSDKPSSHKSRRLRSTDYWQRHCNELRHFGGGIDMARRDDS